MPFQNIRLQLIKWLHGDLKYLRLCIPTSHLTIVLFLTLRGSETPPSQVSQGLVPGISVEFQELLWDIHSPKKTAQGRRGQWVIIVFSDIEWFSPLWSVPPLGYNPIESLYLQFLAISTLCVGDTSVAQSLSQGELLSMKTMVWVDILQLTRTVSQK